MHAAVTTAAPICSGTDAIAFTPAAPTGSLAFTGTSSQVPATVEIGAVLLALGALMLLGAVRIGRRTAK